MPVRSHGAESMLGLDEGCRGALPWLLLLLQCVQFLSQLVNSCVSAPGSAPFASKVALWRSKVGCFSFLMADPAIFLMNLSFSCCIVVTSKGCVLCVSDSDTLDVYILRHLASSFGLLGQF